MDDEQHVLRERSSHGEPLHEGVLALIPGQNPLLKKTEGIPLGFSLYMRFGHMFFSIYTIATVVYALF